MQQQHKKIKLSTLVYTCDSPRKELTIGTLIALPHLKSCSTELLHRHCVKSYILNTLYSMSLWFECSNVIEIRDELMLDFHSDCHIYQTMYYILYLVALTL